LDADWLTANTTMIARTAFTYGSGGEKDVHASIPAGRARSVLLDRRCRGHARQPDSNLKPRTPS
jgi:hypothetical protein